jgi:transcriptional regulator with XRE-family HTH domain
LYKYFQKLLERDGTTAYRVAKSTGITNSKYTEWKKGTYTPKLDKLQKIAAHFGVTLEYLLTGEEAEHNG